MSEPLTPSPVSKPRRKISTRIPLPAVLSLLVGLGIVAFGLRDLGRARASTGWPTTTGTITESSVEQIRGHRTESNGTKRTKIRFEARIRYQYQVDRIEYSGERIAFADLSSRDSTLARELVDAYPKGKQVEVRYMPGDPQESVLQPGIQQRSLYMPGFGLAFIAAGIYFMVFHRNSRSSLSLR